MKNVISNQNTIIEIKTAHTFRQKFAGLMLKKECDYALLFRNTRYLHTFFMRFDLDIIFLNKNDDILEIRKNIKPFRIILPPKKTKSVIEIMSGKLDKNNNSLFIT
jgi:uncharacterized membrane protein (UPF0127 family)